MWTPSFLRRTSRMASKRPSPVSGEELSGLVAGMVAGYLNTGDEQVRKAVRKSGRIRIEVEVCLDRGEIPWTTGSVTFEERRNYP